MAGSKKGERRGAAKRRINAEAKASMDIGKTKPQVFGAKKPGKSRLTFEAELAIARAWAGDVAAMPKEVMLQWMRDAVETASEYKAIMLANLNAGLEDGAQWAEGKWVWWMNLAMEAAYKAAPYYHARLQAIMVAPSTGDDDDNQLIALLKEIDEQSRVRAQFPAPERMQ